MSRLGIRPRAVFEILAYRCRQKENQREEDRGDGRVRTDRRTADERLRTRRRHCVSVISHTIASCYMYKPNDDDAVVRL